MKLSYGKLGCYCRDAAGAFVRAAGAFVYPPSCPCCGADETTRNADPALCATCSGAMLNAEGPSCQKCGAPVGPFLDTKNGCVHCRDDSFAFETVHRVGRYEGLLRELCLRAKGSQGETLAAAGAGLLWEQSRTALEQTDVDATLAVPQHWTRQFRRVHNPSQTSAHVLARRLKVEFLGPILRKVRRTAAQASLSHAERRKNLRGAFRVGRTARLSGRTVLLVDDVLTTGTTANEVSKVLRQAGAKRVIVAVLARGLGRPRTSVKGSGSSVTSDRDSPA